MARVVAVLLTVQTNTPLGTKQTIDKGVHNDISNQVNHQQQQHQQQQQQTYVTLNEIALSLTVEVAMVLLT